MLCFYCGCIATEQDHLFCRGLRVRKRNRKHTSDGKVVPVCNECNRILRMKQLFTVYDRTEYLIEYYCTRRWKQPYTEEQLDRLIWMRNICQNTPV